MNLFVPSRVKWSRGSTPVTLTQHTEFPHRPTTQIEIGVATPSSIPVYIRIPAWSGSKTTIAVNRKTIVTGPEPGKFTRVDRTWKDGGRIEVEFDMPTVLEPVDAQHPNLVAAVHGPLALFAIGEIPERVQKSDLLAVSQIASGSTEWHAKTEAGNLPMRPFAAIQDEHYRLYLNVAS